MPVPCGAGAALPGNLAWEIMGAGGALKEDDVEAGTAAARGGDASPL